MKKTIKITLDTKKMKPNYEGQLWYSFCLCGWKSKCMKQADLTLTCPECGYPAAVCPCSPE